jgi:hypothetical protein
MLSTPHVSAGGAKQYSPERSAAELRDSIPSRPNPFQGMTEMATHPGWRRFADGRAFRRPVPGALSILSEKPGVPLRSAPGSNPPPPPGTLFGFRYT